MEKQTVTNKGQQTQVAKKQKKNKVILVLIFVIIAAIATIAVLGFKYYETQNKLSITTNELNEFKFSLLPTIEKNSSVQTLEEYYTFITSETFASKYQLQLDANVKLNYRDKVTSSEITSGQYGNNFNIAYIKKATDGKNAGKYCVFFPIVENNPVTNTSYTTIVYVTIDDISANLPYAATGSFVKSTF